jgi:hypothetical protein
MMRLTNYKFAGIFLFLVMGLIGVPAAHADTIITTGGFVTEIQGLNIDGTLYNVTFGTTADLTFATNGEAGDAATDIVTALGTNNIVSSARYNPPYNVQLFCVLLSTGQCQTGVQIGAGTAWSLLGLTGGLNPGSPAFGAGAYYAEFSPTVATPEPSSLVFTLTGVGILGFSMLMRKRKVLALLPQAT